MGGVVPARLEDLRSHYSEIANSIQKEVENNSLRYINAINLIGEEKYDEVYRNSKGLTPSQLETYSFRGFPLANLLAMDIALSHKIHNRLDLSAEALECCRSHIVCLCLMLNVLENILQSLEIDIVISLEGYSIHSLGRLVACRMGIEHRFIVAMYRELVPHSFRLLATAAIWQRRN